MYSLFFRKSTESIIPRLLQIEIAEDDRALRQRYFADLEPEPPMGVLEVLTFPARASVTVGSEAQESPARFRLRFSRAIEASRWPADAAHEGSVLPTA